MLNRILPFNSGVYFLFVLIVSLSSCSNKGTMDSETNRQTEELDLFDSTSVVFDLADIKERGSLRVILENTSTDYFLYKGQAMGFQYDLIQDFANNQDLKLDIIIENNFERGFQLLLKGEADIFAHSITITKNRLKIISFSDPQYEIRQMLVQRKPDNYNKLKEHEIEDKLIRSPSQLIDQEISVKKGSSYIQRLKNLSAELGGDITIKEEDLLTEELINNVSEGKIIFTVSDEDIADINATYLDNIDVQTPLSLPTQVGWAVRPNSPELLILINQWLAHKKNLPDYNVLRQRYFESPKKFKRLVQSDFSSQGGGNISQYDDLIKKYSSGINWDWRLLAALIFQESQFDPKSVSWMGAQGLMQLVPNTAKEFGAKSILNPEQNIMAGTKYLDWLDNYWKKYIEDPTERLNFVIASYNAGQGHVLDAMNLAEKYGKDPKLWHDHVDFYLLQKSKPKYYQDPIVKYGYCRGREPVNYVKSIFEQFSIYQQFIPN